ncbi:MAG: sodium:proton antiporter [Paludibacteraceae bacterium]|nr:sodium:proton antiporter [Paludibacteraceae bacterium]
MEIPVFSLIPFVIMLLCIAVGPLVAEHWWENNRNKLIVSLILGIPTAIWLCLNGLSDKLIHQMVFDYVPFIILLTALFTVTGGIRISGNLAAKPIVNTAFLGIGYLLASIMGTTGAAMLLIRPLIETNQERKHKVHTILFFIAAVANCGGLLTPLGDPPLFLLYLKGAEFTWFMGMLPEWALAGALLLLVYFIVDTMMYKKEDAADIARDNNEKTSVKITGNINFLYLIGVVCAVAFINPGTIPAMGDHHAPIYVRLLREIVLVILILASWFTTKQQIRKDNNYSWGPIIEVAVLFVGIFATMTPALLFLEANAGSLGITEPWQFVYATGALSSFLDNAPTALAFHSVALGLDPALTAGATMVAGIPEVLLKAISMGAVFFGAMTYIGNGPNFMVKAIAEQNKIQMPSFFGYMFKFSLVVLLPINVITQLIFL